jgi:G3E family GTPase
MSCQSGPVSPQEESAAVPLRVTVLCGFVGAGKSRVLCEALAHQPAGPVAVLMHDRGEAFGERVAGWGGGVEVFRLGEALAELVQDCVGCSLRESLTEAMTAIARMQRFSRLIIECSGLAEPMMVADVFNEAWADDAPLATLARLDQIVAVVDAERFWDDVHSADDLQGRGLSCGADDARTLSELLVEQVEYSTVVVVNKCERIGPEAHERLCALLQCLNPEAPLMMASAGPVVAERLLSCRPSADEPIGFQPGWTKLLEAEPMPAIRSPRWTTGIFRATRPFHPERLWSLMEEGWPGVERCKGFFWLASQPDRCFAWAQTAGVRHYECLGDWWAATPREEWPTGEDFQRRLQKHWTIEFGDRHQELACIGYGLDQQHLFRRLRACLLTPSEVLLGEEGWRRFDDPFARATQEAASRDEESDGH